VLESHRNSEELLPTKAANAEGDTQSEVPEWELRERQERGEGRRLEAEKAGTEVEERLQFFHTPSFITTAQE